MPDDDHAPTARGAVPRPGPLDASSRRAFLMAALAGGAALALPGCGESSRVTSLPGPAWPSEGPPAGTPYPAPAPSAGEPGTAAMTGIIPRSRWAGGQPVPRLMNRMLPVLYITVHHSAGPVFYEGDVNGTARRLESIRRYHRGDLGWGDIGYHYAVDRAGRVWECRPAGWQGAHVRDHNEGNIGVVALGNFDQQEPSPQQVEGLRRQVRSLMSRYRVPVSRVRTHQEWAPTACPGRRLQRYMESARATGKLS